MIQKIIKKLRRYVPLPVVAVLAAVTAGSCHRMVEVPQPEGPSERVLITVSVPDAQIPASTRGIAAGGEDEVRTIDLLIFDASAADEVFVERVEGTKVSQDGNTVTFTAPVRPTDGQTRIVVVANVENMSDIAGAFQAGVTKKKAVMAALVYASDGSGASGWKWDAGADSYRPIPMYGEKVVSAIKIQMPPITGIQLVRMLARVDIVNSTTSGFTVEEVYLVNYRTGGYIPPAWDEATGLLAENPGPDPQIPAGAGKRTGIDDAIVYPVNGSALYQGEIYAYEAEAAQETWRDTESVRRDAVCLVIKGKGGDAGAVSSYYRVDFAQAGEDGKVEYMPLKRNYKYILNVQRVDGAGYASPQEALDAYTVPSNLKIRILSYNRAIIRDVVFNGQYMLGVEQTEYTLQKLSENRRVRLFTDYPGGWTARISADWLTFVGGSEDGKEASGGAGDDSSSLVFRVAHFEGAAATSSRTASIEITAGRLSHRINVTQTGVNTATLKITDENGNPVDKIDFWYHPTDTDIKAKRVFLSWTGVDICFAQRGDGTTIGFEVLTPHINNTGMDMTRLTGGTLGLVMKPIKYEDTDIWNASRWDYLSFILFDTETDWVWLAGAGLAVNQRGIAIEAQSDPTGYLLGNSSYSLPVRSNSPWRLAGMTSNGVPVGDLVVSGGGTMQVGATGGPSGSSEQTDQLTFKTGGWQKSRTGAVTLAFEGTDSERVFRQEFTLSFRSPWLDYTDNEKARYYVYPGKFMYLDDKGVEQAVTMTKALAQAECAKIGSGWRLPRMNELLTAYVYRTPLGQMNYHTEYGWFWGHHWSDSDRGDGKFLTIDVGNGYVGWNAPTAQLPFRCVYEEASAKKYPYVEVRTEGRVIVSRDSEGGVPTNALLPGTAAPPTGNEGDDAHNRVAAKLLVADKDENTSATNYYNWAEANAKCAAKAGGGWRLPTQREAILIWAMGGTASSTYPSVGNNPAFGTWASPYVKMNSDPYLYWLSTLSSTDEELPQPGPAAWVLDVNTLITNKANKEKKGPDAAYVRFGGVRCVKSVD